MNNDDDYIEFEDFHDPNMMELYTRSKTVWKNCAKCGKREKIKRGDAYCNSCINELKK